MEFLAVLQGLNWPIDRKKGGEFETMDNLTMSHTLAAPDDQRRHENQVSDTR
jgi:hypothetical protein